MAHKRKGAYVPPDSEPGWTLFLLRREFIIAIEKICPTALQEYRALDADQVEAWAERHYLTADWLIKAARAGLLVADEGRPPRLLLSTVFKTPDVPSPETPSQLSYTWGAYVGEEDPSAFRQRHLEAFTRMLDEQVNAAVKRLDAREANGELARDGFIQANTLKNIRHAAQWQLLGDMPLQGEARAIRKTLQRIGLKPRPGLA